MQEMALFGRDKATETCFQKQNLKKQNCTWFCLEVMEKLQQPHMAGGQETKHVHRISSSLFCVAMVQQIENS